MQEIKSCGTPNPQDLSLHKQLKDIADLLKPELSRLHKAPHEATGNLKSYASFIEQIRMIKKEVTNQDALFALQNVISHMKKVISLVEKNKSNEEILWVLQEIMAILFKVQNLPS
jgi:hypothetical protein